MRRYKEKAPLLEPVRGSGWYEREDGTVTRYRWEAGRLIECETVAGWENVPDGTADWLHW